MEKEIFDIEKFNVISDEENYYFFRSLEPGDVEDLEKGIIKDGENYQRLRTDRERWEETHQEVPRWNAESKVTLEEMYNHIKMHYSLQTNCISLSSNANVARTYGEAFSDKYVMIKVPKKEMGEKVFHAGQYMLDEIEKKVEQRITEGGISENILKDLQEVENAKTSDEIKELIKRKYKTPKKLDETKARPNKGINYKSPHARVSSWQSLDEKQTLEKNKIIAKLTILEHKKLMEPLMSHSANNNLLVRTVGNAFASSEQIYYGDIEGNRITDISKEALDMFSLLQQVDGQDKQIVDELKRELIRFVNSGNKIEIPANSILSSEAQAKDDISIEEMYELTDGKVEYGEASSIVKNLFYLAKGQASARVLADELRKITNNNPKYEQVIKYIEENGFEIEPKIITRQSNKGYKLSESVNLNLAKDEQILVDEIKKLSANELDEVLQNGGVSNVQDVISKVYGKQNEQIDKSRYYAEAIISQYDWSQIGIEEFKISERNELIKRLQDKNCVDIYENLRQSGVDTKQIPTILLNIATRQGFFEEYEKGNLEQLLNTRQDVLQNSINIELVERFLGYYDVENTEIRLKDYQQRAYDNVNKIFEDHKFAQVILPTGAGKSFVALAQMQKYAEEHPGEKMLYLAPQDEILNQIKNYIIKYVHGKQNTVGKTEDEIIAEIFPNISFETYSGLLAKRGQEVIKEQYGMIVLDELHRTGAKEWEGKIDGLLDNQNEDVKVLGITATPVRDADGRDMAEETAKKLGYTDEEVKQRKHLASNMTLENAIRMGYVVNPKLVYCKYDLISSGKMDELRAKIDDIEDESKRAEELQKYNELRQKLNRKIDDEIGEDARKQLEEAARKNLDNGIGKEEILRQNVKKGGKYIVFIPVTDQGEIEDEDGKRIGTKTGEDKIQAYQEYLNKVFDGTDIVPQLHSLLGSYSKDKNKEELEAFESDSSEETKFMVVMNKANEGLHVDGVDGIIWFRALDENSRILYLQQLGRAIYALDEDNPLPDDERPVVIDLANNSLTVKIEKEFEDSEPIDDLEALTIIIDWINIHNGMIPNRESSNKQEQHYYAVLRRIQSKYSKYLDGFDNFEDLTDEDKSRIQEIIELASEIDLWDMELPPIPKTRGSKKEFDPFTVEGILKDFVEFKDEINEINRLTPFEEVLKFAEENGRMPKQSQNKASERTEKESEEDSLYHKWRRAEEKKTVDRYFGIKIEEIPEKDRELIKLIRDYGYLGKRQNELTPFEEVIKFAEENGRMPKRLNKKASERTEKESAENKLCEKWRKTKEKETVDRYFGIKIEEIPEKDRELVKLIRNYGYLGKRQNELTPFEEIIKFAEENGRMPKQSHKKPSEKTEKERAEDNLYNKWRKTKEKETVDRYFGIKIEEIPEKDRELVELIRNYGYGVTTFEEVIKFAEENGRMPKRLNKKASERTEKESAENKLYEKWLKTKERETVEKYSGIKIEEIPEKDRELVELIRNYGYGVTPFEEIIKFAEENGRMPKRLNKKVSERTEKESEEDSLYHKWRKTKEKKILEEYAGQPLENVPEEDREKIAKLRIYGMGINPSKLRQAKQQRDDAKSKNDQAKELEKQVSEQLKKRGQAHEEQ